MPDETTDFGFETVPTEEKSERVRQVFDSVAARYDPISWLFGFERVRVPKVMEADESNSSPLSEPPKSRCETI